MKRYHIRLIEGCGLNLPVRTPEVGLHGYSADLRRANCAFLKEFETFPERGTVRDIRDGMRIAGVERRVSIAFVSFKSILYVDAELPRGFP